MASIQSPQQYEAQPFPLLDLSKEIRFGVYETLTRLRNRFDIDVPIANITTPITLVTRGPIPPIFVTRRPVHDVYTIIVKARLKRRILSPTIPLIIIPTRFA